MVTADQTVALSICDITRPMPSATILPSVLRELNHIPKDQVLILVATGTHRANTIDELAGMLGRKLIEEYQVTNHDAFDPNGLLNLGKTPEGIPIWLNRQWAEADTRITIGLVEPHFFAGFSGGPKMVAPGLTGFETTMRLHNAEMIGHPKSTWGVTQGNPIHDTIRQIALQTGVDFSVDVTINRNHQITSVYAGDQNMVHRAASRFVRSTAMQRVDSPFDVVVTSNSGYPLDLNLYQAVKGMSAAAQVVKTGGTIICAAECSEGLPDHGEYSDILSSAEGPEELLRTICSPDHNRHDQWEVQIQAQIQLKAEVLLKSEGLTDAKIRAAHLTPVRDLEVAVADALEQHGPSSRVCVLPEGPQTIPYLGDVEGG